MPKVPVMEQNQRLRPGNPTGFQSSRNARLRGDSLTAFGNSVTGFGAALQKSEERKKNAKRRYVNSDMKSAYTKRLQDLAQEISKRPESDAESDKEAFDLGSAEILSEVVDEMTEKHGGDFTKDFDGIAGGVSNGFRANIITGTAEKQKRAMKRGITETTSRLNGNIYANPSSLSEGLMDYTNTVTGTMYDLGASEDDMLKSERAGHQALAKTAVDGYLAQKKYAEAKNVVLGEAGHLYDSDQTRAEIKRIKDTQISDLNLSQRQNDRALNLREKNHKKVQQEIATQARVLLSDAKTPEQRHKAITFIKDHAKKNNLAYGQVGGLLSDGKAKFKEIDASSSYKLSQEAFKASTSEDFDKVLNKAQNLEETENMRPETAQRWESIVNSLRKARASNPARNKMYKAMDMKLEAHTKPMDMIEKMTDSLNKNVLLRRKIEAHADLKILEANNVDPVEAYKQVINSHFRGTDSLGIFPGYKGIPKTEEELRLFTTWGRGVIKNHELDRIREFKAYAIKAKDAIAVDIETNNIKNSKPVKDSTIKSQPSIMSPKEVEALRGEIFDFDELFKNRGDQLPLIYRRD